MAHTPIMKTSHKKTSFLLSVIIPAYNEEGNIEPLLARLLPLLKPYSYEIIFVNDGSSDSTVADIKAVAAQNPRIKLISFVRNFGQQKALLAGYHYAKGDAVLTIDADLQDPPELLHDMIAKWQTGSQVVYARRGESHEGPFKKFTSRTYYKLIDSLSETHIPHNVGEFRLVDRAVVEMIKVLPEKSSFLRGLVAWGGFPASEVVFERKERAVGETHFTLAKMLQLALDGIVAFSLKPLHIASYIGFTSAFLGFGGIIYAIYRRIFLPQQFWVEGWTATFVGIMFFGGVQLLTIGIIGEYIGRIYKQVQGRPDYVVGETENI